MSKGDVAGRHNLSCQDQTEGALIHPGQDPKTGGMEEIESIDWRDKRADTREARKPLIETGTRENVAETKDTVKETGRSPLYLS